MYTAENLMDLAKYLKERYRELKKDKNNTEDPQPLMDLARQLDAIYYNELIFEDILKEYDVSYQLMEEPLDDMPLHLNDAGILSHELVSWRLTIGI